MNKDDVVDYPTGSRCDTHIGCGPYVVISNKNGNVTFKNKKGGTFGCGEDWAKRIFKIIHKADVTQWESDGF